MTCREIDPCGMADCDALVLVQSLLPRGRLWYIGRDRAVYDGFWSAVAEFFGDVSRSVCAEWCQAEPCTANRTLARWAAVWSYPTDCTALDTARLCEWIKIITCEARPGSCAFVPRLLSFVGLHGLTVEFDRGCGPVVDLRPEITIGGPASLFAKDALGCPVIPEVECLRHRYFPAGVSVKYIPS